MLRMNGRMYEITLGEHDAYRIPFYGFRGSPVGIDLFRVLSTGIQPVIDGGLAGRDGGQIGAGILRALELEDPVAFGMVRDFTYEAYYGNPQVLAVLERETGWRSANSTEGGSMDPFDESLLARVRTLPPTYKRV
jgi:hypothetical protein